MFSVKNISDKIQDGFRKLKVLAFGKSDVKTGFLVLPFGVDSVPVKDVKLIYSDTANKKEPVIIGCVFGNRIAEKGELRLFSTDDDGEEQGYVYLKKDGNLHLLSDADNAVRYSELETAFDQLKSDFDDLVSKYNGHTHIVPQAPSGTTTSATTTSTDSPSTADITPSKIEEIKVP